MPEDVSRVVTQDVTLPPTTVGRVESRVITMGPDVAAGPHLHNGPVFGSIRSGSVTFQVDGGPAQILRAGDHFYEPGGVRIDRFDATDEGVVFDAHFLLAAGQDATLEQLPR